MVDGQGEFLGIVSLEAALEVASERGLDLVEVAPDASPPVCKIVDYDKLRFEERKKKSLKKKKQKSLETKELQFRPKIGDNDYQVKIRHATRFLTEGHRVRVVLRFKGREMSHQEMGVRLIERVVRDLSDLGKAEMATKTEGRRMLLVLVPLPKKTQVAKEAPSGGEDGVKREDVSNTSHVQETQSVSSVPQEEKK